VCALTDSLGGAETVAVRGDTLYIGLSGDDTLAGVISCQTNGCFSSTVGPSHLTPANGPSVQIEQIVTNATDLYASDYYSANGGFLHVDPTGAVTRLAGTQGRSYGLAIDTSSAYWVEASDPGNLWWCALPACPSPQRIRGPLSYPERIVVTSDGAIVYTDSQGFAMWKCNAKADCATPVRIPSHPGSVNAMVVDGSTLYWAVHEEILSCSLSPLCANPTSIVTGTPGEIVTAIAVSGPQLYYATLPITDAADWVNTDGVVKKCAISSCTGNGIQVLATKQPAPSAMTLDTKSVYWANGGERGSTGGHGSVMKAPR
jgi:hypothetical protein